MRVSNLIYYTQLTNNRVDGAVSRVSQEMRALIKPTADARATNADEFHSHQSLRDYDLLSARVSRYQRIESRARIS